MHRSTIAALLATPLLALGCAPGESIDGIDGEQQVPILEIVGSPEQMGDTPRGVYLVIPPEYAKSPDVADDGTTAEEPGTVANALPAARYTLYMNKDGGTYTPGINNSSTNRSTVPQQTSQILPWNVSDAGWQQVMSCVRDMFAPFDIEVTDVDPGDAPHFESVVAGRPGDLQLPSNVGGVSPFTSDCSTIDRSIVYTFAEVYGDNYQVICEVVAQETAHSFGLDHQFLCEDPMTYLGGCGAKTFQDIDAQCGEDQPRTCACGQQTQNSVQMLNARIGAADALAPNVGILSPSDGARVGPGFTVSVDATDDVGVARVELYIDGVLAETKTQPPYSFVTDANIDLGTHVIETRAYDSKNESTESIAVTVEEDIDPDDPIDPDNPDDPDDPDGPSPSDIVGGCNAGGSGGSSLAFVLLGALFIARRRRRA